MNPLHDPDLLEILDSLDAQPFKGIIWRVTWANRKPLAAGTGGGRWNPPSTFEALYSSLDKHGAVAEIYYHLSKAPIFSSTDCLLHKLEIHAGKILTLGFSGTLERLGVNADDFRLGRSTQLTQEIGAAAHFLEMDGLLVPSARWDCQNLVLFPENHADKVSLKGMEASDINWPAWREQIYAEREN